MTGRLGRLLPCLVKVDRRNLVAWTELARRRVLQDLTTQLARESVRRKTQLPFEQRNHRLWKRDFPIRVENVFGGEIIGHHENRHVANHLACRRDLDDIAKQFVDCRIGRCDLIPARVQSHRTRLLT